LPPAARARDADVLSKYMRLIKWTPILICPSTALADVQSVRKAHSANHQVLAVVETLNS